MTDEYRDVWRKYTGLTFKMTILREGGSTIETAAIFCSNDGSQEDIDFIKGFKCID